MLQDKMMVNDVLVGVKSSLTAFASVLSECDNPALRSAIVEIRNNCENSQYELYKLAQTKGFYKPAPMAEDTEVQQVSAQLQI